MIPFVKELPPRAERGGRPAKYVKEAAEIRRRPFEYGILAELETAGAASSLANAIRNGKYVAFVEDQDGRFDASSRGTTVYVSFQPASKSAPDAAA
ncbi:MULTISPECIES: hypothetical protein [Nocardia]|uniref:hypothetical protein n=1 Tax=Nocardia TaxID=1817 RepID=UPI000D694E4A|nr:MULTISPECIES: hypothetical protein [Nocardia]